MPSFEIFLYFLSEFTCSKTAMKTPEQRLFKGNNKPNNEGNNNETRTTTPLTFGAFISNFEQLSQSILVFPLLTLNKYWIGLKHIRKYTDQMGSYIPAYSNLLFSSAHR